MQEVAPQSWEMPPHSKVVSETEARLSFGLPNGALSCTLQLIQIPACRRPILWFRPHGENFQSGFVAFEPRFRQTMHFDNDTALFALRLSLADVWRRGLFARHFVLNVRGELRGPEEEAHEAVLVAPDGIGVWSLAALVTDVRDASAFQWAAAPLASPDFLRLPARDVWSQFVPSLQDPRSEAAIARQFAQLSEAQRETLIWKWAHGTEDDFKAVLHDLLCWQDVWSKVPKCNELKLRVREAQSVEIEWEDDVAVYALDVPSSFLEAVALVWRWFEPVNSDLAEVRCVRDWMRWHNHRFEIVVQRPSAHEQLEAHWRWREWLETRGA